MFVLTSENMKKAEEAAVQGGKDYYSLMDKAGTGCADVISEKCKNTESKAVILCGKGRNGGDGLVIAERLWQKGYRKIFVILINGEITESLCRQMYERAARYPINFVDMTTNAETAIYHISTADIIADSIFGIGFKGELRGNAADAVAEANKNTLAKKFAIDIPSGLTADGDFHSQLFFKTDITLTMIAYKPVHVLNSTRNLCGETHIIDIGVGDDCLTPFAEKYTAFTESEVKTSMKKRLPNDNKGDYGKILTICGSKNMTGCVYLCNQAAVEIGAGLVTAAFPDCIYNTVTAKLNETTFLPLPSNENGRISSDSALILAEKLKNYSAIAIGCGIGVDSDTKKVVSFILENAKCPIILDADGLNCITGDLSVLKNSEADIIITPHPGEMSRLTGKNISEIQSDRMNTAQSFAKEYNVTVLLKGNGTVIASPDGRVAINTTGNAGMARGGSGDVLTGITATLAAQMSDAFTAAASSAYIHGKTADKLKDEFGILSPTPTRITENIHKFYI